MNYSIFIQYDADDKIYVANVPELEGCMAHGYTYEEAINEIQVAIALWLECAQETGVNIPKPNMYIEV